MLKPESHNDARGRGGDGAKNEGHSCGNADVTNSQRGGECKLIPSRGERERERENEKGRFQSHLPHGSFIFCERDGCAAGILNSRNATPSPILVAFILVSPAALPALIPGRTLAMALRSLFPCPVLTVSAFEVSSSSSDDQDNRQKACRFHFSLKNPYSTRSAPLTHCCGMLE